MKRRYALTFTVTLLAGAALHFLYTWLPLPLIGLFAPVNESVWEHLKLLYWPVLTAGFFLTQGENDQMRAWSGILLAELVMPLFLTGSYYLLRCGFGVHALWIDIALYAMTMSLGFWLAYCVQKSGRLAFLAGVLVILTGIYGAALVLFTLAPPMLPIFMET